MNQFANRATADEMKQALAGEIDPATSKPKAAKPKAGAKDKAGEKTRTYREDVIALSQAAAKVGKRGGELMELGTLDPKDQVLLIHSLEAALKLHRGLLDLASKNFKAAAAK